MKDFSYLSRLYDGSPQGGGGGVQWAVNATISTYSKRYFKFAVGPELGDKLKPF